jgi:Domain of unknown function (DUF4333)
VPAITSHKAATRGLTPARRARVRFAAFIMSLLAAAFLAGCTFTFGRSSHTVDQASTADTISRKLREQLPDVRVGSIACPKGVKVAEGVTFQCTADVAGGQLPVTVTLTHVNTDSGAYDYNFKWAKAVINTDKIVDGIQSRLPVEAANATVDCGTPRVRVVEVGGAVTCTISQGGNRQVMRAVVDDVSGTAHFDPAELPPLRPKARIGKIGDKLTVYDEFGDGQLEVTVTKLKFSSGDEIDRPVRGLFMGASVKVHALADEQDLPDLYALVGSQHYDADAIVTSSTFDPLLDYSTLRKGERASGWLVFDVPGRHGQLVLHDLDGHEAGAWKY